MMVLFGAALWCILGVFIFPEKFAPYSTAIFTTGLNVKVLYQNSVAKLKELEARLIEGVKRIRLSTAIAGLRRHATTFAHANGVQLEEQQDPRDYVGDVVASAADYRPSAPDGRGQELQSRAGQEPQQGGDSRRQHDGQFHPHVGGFSLPNVTLPHATMPHATMPNVTLPNVNWQRGIRQRGVRQSEEQAIYERMLKFLQNPSEGGLSDADLFDHATFARLRRSGRFDSLELERLKVQIGELVSFGRLLPCTSVHTLPVQSTVSYRYR